MTFLTLSPQDRVFQQADTVMTDTADDELAGAPPSGNQIYVTGVYCTNAHATTGTVVNFKQGSTTLFGHFAAADGGGFGFQYATPIPWGAGNSLAVANATNGSNTHVQVTFYVGAA